MKKLIILIVIIAVSCATNRGKSIDKLEAKITNKFIKDCLDIEIEMTNNTSKNYYLQFDISKLHNPITFFSSEYLHNIGFNITRQ